MTIRVSCTAQEWKANFAPGDRAPLVLPSTLTIGEVFVFLQRELPGAEITIELTSATKGGGRSHAA
jgi:hypothetical protein